MEAQRRRLAILLSHLRPPTSQTRSPVSLSASSCSSSPAPHADHASNQEIDCVFCKIIRGESPALKLYEDDICLCILDTSPLSHGHCLIIPKAHFSSLQATPSPIVGAMCSKIPCISSAVMKATGCDSFNLLVNNGAAAGQVIFHTHIHIIPRKARDCLWASESLRRRALKLDKETSQLTERIREQLLFLNDPGDGKDLGSASLEAK